MLHWDSRLSLHKNDKINLNLPPSIVSLIERIVAVARPQKLLIFGSRARETARLNSDFDLCVIGRACSDTDWTRLVTDLEFEPWTLFRVDLVEFETTSQDLRENILKEGLVLYGKTG